jgi:hypothetical protein
MDLLSLTIGAMFTSMDMEDVATDGFTVSDDAGINRGLILGLGMTLAESAVSALIND